MSTFAAFLAVSIVVIVTPGQDTALTIRNALLGGRRSGAFTALGVAAGQACWTIAAAAGVAALLRASEPAFVALKIAGAAYLILLGAHALAGALLAPRSPIARRARVSDTVRAVVSDTRHSPVSDTACADRPLRRLTATAAFRHGVISNLGNPKMAVFFTSLLPQFAGGRASFLALLALGLVFCLLTLVWLTGYAFAVAKAGDLILRPRIRRALDAVMGAVLVGLGIRLATEQR